MEYQAKKERYDNMEYRKSGKSGLKISAISLGLWHNFSHNSSYTNARKLVLRSFDVGITNFDIADCYGPPYGAAEEIMGKNS